MMVKIIFSFILIMSLSSCLNKLPKTYFESKSNGIYYIPFDPLEVPIQHGNKKITKERILRALPDEIMRLAIATRNSNGKLEYGSNNIGYKSKSYEVILDYIKYSTAPLGIDILDSNLTFNQDDPEFMLPVYLGIGLRLKASINVLDGEVNLSNLIAIGAAAKAERISGSLVIQTLGISGESVSASIPFPSEISEESIQNAILALGSIRGKIYSESTQIKPRVLGILNTTGDKNINLGKIYGNIMQQSHILDLTKYDY